MSSSFYVDAISEIRKWRTLWDLHYNFNCIRNKENMIILKTVSFYQSEQSECSSSESVTQRSKSPNWTAEGPSGSISPWDTHWAHMYQHSNRKNSKLKFEVNFFFNTPRIYGNDNNLVLSINFEYLSANITTILIRSCVQST